TPVPRSTAMRLVEKIRGPLPQVIARVTQLLWDRSEHSYPLEGDQRLEEHAYPRVVLRELTVNALCHRDWSQTGSHVRVQLYPNAVEWISPGGLAEGVTIENLLDVQYSRNPSLVNLLFQAGYIEGLGLGMDTVFGALHENQNPPPQLRDSDNAFTVRVTARPIRASIGALTASERKDMICTLLAQRGALTIGDLETTLQTTRRTIQRDLTELIKAERVATSGTTNDRRYQLLAQKREE
ncbi:MAG: DeoR family transcriptional regulator, partial [Chloroflexales bacterium]|nr:DeoR family transcriptional regulator [Chloroflexales bacterium]